jgi:hypothetical protein
MYAGQISTLRDDNVAVLNQNIALATKVGGFPAVQIFAIEQRLPVLGRGLRSN